MTRQNHGLVNRVLQRFVRDSYGADAWRRIAAEVGLSPPRFEPMLRYDVALTLRVLGAVQRISGQPRNDLLCDIGIYLGAHPHMTPLQRLLRFGADDFDGFLRALEDVPDRARLALPGLDLPRIEVHRVEEDTVRVSCVGHWPEYAQVLNGFLQAMAPHYGCETQIECVPVLQSGREASRSRMDLLVCARQVGRIAGEPRPFAGRVYRHTGALSGAMAPPRSRQKTNAQGSAR